MKKDVYLLLGSNIENRKGNISKALQLLANKIGEVVKLSSLYETAAWGKTDQSAFINQAVLIQTEMLAINLLACLKSIEKKVGRTDTEKWGPRVIDIDILFYNTEIIQTPTLQVPHPYLPVRRFALLPLAEIAEVFVHPVLKKNIAELLAECPDKNEASIYK